MKVSLSKTYHGVVRARHRTAIFQVMDFCVVAREQPPKKEVTRKSKESIAMSEDMHGRQTIWCD